MSNIYKSLVVVVFGGIIKFVCGGEMVDNFVGVD